MVMKKMRKKALQFTATGITMGVGASLLSDSSIGSANAKAGIGKMSGFLPVTGTVMGAGMALESLNSLKTKKRKRR